VRRPCACWDCFTYCVPPEMLLCFLDIEIITAEADAVKVNNV